MSTFKACSLALLVGALLFSQMGSLMLGSEDIVRGYSAEVITRVGTSTARNASLIDSDKAMRALRGNGWYNSEKQAYNPPVLDRSVDDTIRRTGWEAKPSSWDWNFDWPTFGSFGSWGVSADSVGWIILFVLGTALIVGIVATLYFFYRDSLPYQKRLSKRSQALQIDPTKVEDLPFEVREQSGDPLRDAESLMRSGRYNEAVVYLYGYMLLALDHARKIHLQKGKTNRMYLRELRTFTQLKSIANRTMLAFEDVYFGRHDIDAARFSTLWAQLDEFHRLVQPIAPEMASTDGKVAAL